MARSIDRRSFSIIAGGAVAASALGRPAHARARDDGQSLPRPGYPSLDPELARAVVGASHFNLDRVRELVTAQPELARASWDWGFGDWETALGAASHTGRREIALLLIEHGARPTIFSAAMLGEVDVVRAFVSANASYACILGPHGIPLLDHAIVGRDEAADVVEYLRSVAGGAEEQRVLTPEQRAVYVGEYRFGFDGAGVIFVDEHRDRLRLKINDTAARPLRWIGGHGFRASGSESTMISFEIDGGRASAVLIEEPSSRLRGTRADGG